MLVIGEREDMSGEAHSRASLDLPGVQNELGANRDAAARATGKPVVVVLMNGRPLSVPWLAENVPAIVEAWHLGVQTGPALADVLFGDFNPGGKLPVSFPRTVGQVPIYYNHKNTGRPPVEGDTVELEVHRRAVDAALAVRPRTELHDVRLRHSAREQDGDRDRRTRSR